MPATAAASSTCATAGSWMNDKCQMPNGKRQKGPGRLTRHRPFLLRLRVSTFGLRLSAFGLGHLAFGIDAPKALLPARLPLSAATAVTAAPTTAAVASASTAAAIIAAATAASPSATSAATDPAFGFRPGFVHDERATLHLVLVELGNGLLRVVVVRHLDEGEAARATRCHVPHHPDVVDFAGPAKQLGELIFGGRVGEVPDVESPAHAVTYSCLSAASVRSGGPPRAAPAPSQRVDLAGGVPRAVQWEP